jgi:hypothetical protein
MTFFGKMNFRSNDLRWNGIRSNSVRSNGVSVKWPFSQKFYMKLFFGKVIHNQGTLFFGWENGFLMNLLRPFSKILTFELLSDNYIAPWMIFFNARELTFCEQLQMKPTIRLWCSEILNLLKNFSKYSKKSSSFQQKIVFFYWNMKNIGFELEKMKKKNRWLSFFRNFS